MVNETDISNRLLMLCSVSLTLEGVKHFVTILTPVMTAGVVLTQLILGAYGVIHLFRKRRKKKQCDEC